MRLSQIPSTIPLMLVCYKDDLQLLEHSLSAFKSARSLLRFCLMFDHHHDLYVLELEGYSAATHETSHETYNKATHAFYKKYGLPYDQLLAQQGQVILKQARTYERKREQEAEQSKTPLSQLQLLQDM